MAVHHPVQQILEKHSDRPQRFVFYQPTLHVDKATHVDAHWGLKK